jgi:hypothetical protein
MPIKNFNLTIDKWIDELSHYSWGELLAKPNRELVVGAGLYAFDKRDKLLY